MLKLQKLCPLVVHSKNGENIDRNMLHIFTSNLTKIHAALTYIKSVYSVLLFNAQHAYCSVTLQCEKCYYN